MKKIFYYIFTSLSISFALFCVLKFNGYCANTLSIAPSSVPAFETFSQGMASGGFAYGDPVIMTTEALNNINMNLYQLYGYDLVDLSNDVWNSISDPIEWYNALTKYASGEYTVDGNRVDISVANRIAQRISQGALTGAVTAKNLLDVGYRYFSTSVPQWGENAKQFILGKVDEVTQQIVDIAPTMVTKITSQGLSAYNQVYNNLVESGDIVHRTDNNAYIGNSIYYTNTQDNYSFCYTFDSPVFFSCYADGSLACFVPLSECSINETYKTIRLNNFVSGYGIKNNTVTVFNSLNSLSYRSDYVFNINGVDWYFFATLYNDKNFTTICRPELSKGGYSSYIEFLRALLSSNPTLTDNTISYSYVDNALSVALKNQLDRLIGKYVDSITLDRINDIVSSIPIGQELVGDATVPVAVPTQELVDELTNVVDDALVLDEDYAIAFDDAYLAEIDTTPESEPSPYPDSTGTAVPEGFPEAPIFDPLVDIVKTPFSFFSIFEPIFQVFGSSFNFFGVWLCFPVVLIILLIIWSLK